MEAVKMNMYTEEDYYNTPEDMRVELIDGQFYDLACPSRNHQKILGEMYYAIRNYIQTKGGSCEVYPAPFAVKLEEGRDTIVEPDISVICDPAKLTDRGCTGAPDWIIEIISPSTARHDLVRKPNLYQETGVREYWIVDPQNQVVFVHFLENGIYSNKNYVFDSEVKVNIYDDLTISFPEIASSLKNN